MTTKCGALIPARAPKCYAAPAFAESQLGDVCVNCRKLLWGAERIP